MAFRPTVMEVVSCSGEIEVRLGFRRAMTHLRRVVPKAVNAVHYTIEFMIT